MKRIRSSSYFKSLVLVSCIIGILPLLLLGYLSFSKSSSIVKQEVSAGNQLILEQNKLQVEFHLKMIDTLATQMISSPLNADMVSLQTVLGLPYDLSNNKMFKSLVSELIAIQVFELGIEDVHLISFDKDWLVEGGIVYPMTNRDKLDVQNRYLHQLQQQLTAYRDKQQRSYWSLFQNAELGYSLRLVKYIPLNAIDPSGLISVNIPVSEISKRLTEGGQLGSTLILDADGNVLAHSESHLIGSNMQDQRFYTEMMNQGELAGYFSYEINGAPHVVIYNQSKYNQWVYVALMPLDDLMRESQVIKGYTIFSITILIGLIIIMSVTLSFQMYSPIRRIHGFIKPESAHVKGNELKYIGDQVQHMVQSQTRMVDEIESLNRQARIYFVMKLIQGDIKAGELDEYMDKYSYAKDWEQWCLLAIQVDTLEYTQYVEHDHDLLLYAIQNMVEEIVPLSNRLSPIVQNRCILLFIGTPLEKTKPLKVQVFNYAETIQRNVKQYLKLKMSIGISRSHSNLISSPQACQESLDALTYRMRLGQESILFIDDAQPENRDNLRYPKNVEYRIMEAIRQLDHEQAQDGLEQIIQLFSEKHMNLNDHQTFLARLFNNLTGMVQDAGVSVLDVFSKEIFQSDIILKLHSPQKIREWFLREVIDPLLNWMEEQQKKREINISQEIIDAIHQDYDKDLSIELFASRLNYHPSYISRVFKKDTGDTFTEYLSNYRIEVSKKWLRETDMKISDIAQRLRYSTASNFNRNFKKAVKITPSQYREQDEKHSSPG